MSCILTPHSCRRDSSEQQASAVVVATSPGLASLSSAESDCYAMTIGACEALRCASLLSKHGHPPISIVFGTDSFAADSSTERPCGGMMKHIDHSFLPLDDFAMHKQVLSRKLSTDRIPNGLLGEAVDKGKTSVLLNSLGHAWAECVPTLQRSEWCAVLSCMLHVAESSSL